ncbi:uncharacterized protein LOC111715428 isoform X2 [Eurytemora carolleeae]|uniref:uncharacterized protein LOC111715428 isoform X2 n=1 Tax=Eurytemora carolleeae TaxID=1294199 RepID=UPI000C75D5B5|nr:uncharacterized protein LOC111715428 isoform X2 [Eurytemora carolleeae]|eukprot:XP_023346515.1 uncharacterized protein LOC111715428 isoform X2 [Eurytemora affinis]
MINIRDDLQYDSKNHSVANVADDMNRAIYTVNYSTEVFKLLIEDYPPGNVDVDEAEAEDVDVDLTQQVSVSDMTQEQGINFIMKNINIIYRIFTSSHYIKNESIKLGIINSKNLYPIMKNQLHCTPLDWMKLLERITGLGYTTVEKSANNKSANIFRFNKSRENLNEEQKVAVNSIERAILYKHKKIINFFIDQKIEAGPST